MKNSLSKFFPRIIPIFALIVLLLACFFIKPSAPNRPYIDIFDDYVPLASLADAYFFVFSSDFSFEDISALTEDMFDYAGNGAVFYEHDIYDDSDAVNNAIGVYPDISNLVDEGQTIDWRFMLTQDEAIVVIGTYTDISIGSELSETAPIEAEYYLYNPDSLSTTFTNVSPKIAEYIGTGLYYYTDNLYNDPTTVWSQVASEPEYECSSDKYIEWGSAFLCQGKYIVIGRYIDGEKPILPNLIQNSRDYEDSDFIIHDPENISMSRAIAQDNTLIDEEIAFEELNNKYETVADMLKSDVSNGSIVYTNNFRSTGDDGGACYEISDSSSKVDNMFSFKLDNGLYANLQIADNTVNVDQLGAYGDGEHDDVAVLQKAFDSGYNIALGKDKKYKLISNGLTINKNIVIEGNGGTIMMDDSYSPTSDDFKKYLIRCAFNALDYLEIKNLTIDVNVEEDGRYNKVDYFCAFQPKFIKRITLDNTDIRISGGVNQITDFWMDNGCDELNVTNCNFINNSIDREGGIIFLCSRDDKFFETYEAFKNINFKNCRFEGICGDEAIALWGPNPINATFESCTIDWRRANSSNSSRPIAISCEHPKVNFNIDFNNCNIIADSKYADSVVGTGSFYSPDININFNNCDFTANVRDSFLHFQLLPAQASNMSSFDFNADTYGLNFNSCKINCSKTITGSQMWYDTTSKSNWAIDCNFDNCEISCNYCFALLERYSTTKYYYVPKIVVKNCKVDISNALGFIFKSTYSADADIEISNTEVNASNLSSIVSYRYKANNGTGITQSNVNTLDTSISQTMLNQSLTSK